MGVNHHMLYRLVTSGRLARTVSMVGKQADAARRLREIFCDVRIYLGVSPLFEGVFAIFDGRFQADF